jgi:hypothetical protein
LKKRGVLAFAFGVPETILSNRLIAQLASKKAREFGAPVYTQLDIRMEEGIEVDFAEEKPGEPPSTLFFVQGAVRWAMRKKITEIWIVAAKPHLWRCVRDLDRSIEEAGVEIEIRVCGEIEKISEEDWFCVDSTQKRTQTKACWQKRERIIKLMPFFVYKFIAG